MAGRYIHEREDWTAFRWNRERLAEPLADLRHRQGRLVGRMESLGFKLRLEASLETLTVETVQSSGIEGETLNEDQVRSSIARRLGIDTGALPPADRKIEGIVDMMLDATQNFGDRLSAERLCRWQAGLFPDGRSGMSRIRTGAWRNDKDGPMQIVSGSPERERVHFEAPAARRLPHEMRTFLTWFNGKDRLDPVLKAAVAHLWFVTIHPFADGNGRVARAIADMALARSDLSPQRFYSMSAQIRSERKAYYDILERTQKGDLDITVWLEWFLGCLGRAIGGSETVLAGVLGKARFWDSHEAETFNDRQRRILNRLFDGFKGKLTSSRWAALGKCSQDTALRDIDDLVRRGILVKDQAGGRSTSYSLVHQAAV